MENQKTFEYRPFDEPHPCLAGEWAGRGRTVRPRFYNPLLAFGLVLIALAALGIAAGGCVGLQRPALQSPVHKTTR